MIHFTGYGVIARETAHRSIRPNFSVHSVGKLCVGSKNGTFFDGHDELYHRAKFGEDRRPTTRAGLGAKTWCLYVFLSRSEAGALFVRGVHSSNKRCVAVYKPISTRFSAFISEWIALSGALHSIHFCC